MRCIDGDSLFKDICDSISEMTKIGICVDGEWLWAKLNDALENAPAIEPERKKDIVQKFHDYQVDWLKSHYDIELEPQLEEMIVRFLHDTANCYMMEKWGEQECKRQSSTATE